MPYPFVSVVVLNYNGLRFLDACLGSLGRLDYPADRYEVVLVDNVSTDGSADEAEKRFPRVRVVRNERNLGFAAGNNVAMRASTADYVALLNNDAFPEPSWLAALVSAAEGDPRVGICTSKLLFRHDRARVALETATFRPSQQGSSDGRELGVRVLDARVEQSGASREVEYLEGFFGQEPAPEGPFRWTGPRATLGLQVLKNGGEARLQLLAVAPRPGDESVAVALRWGERTLGQWSLGARPRVIEALLPPALVEAATPVIQNAGTLILRDGSGRDRGTVVHGTAVFQEDDLGQYDRQEEVFAGCGAALLLRKRMLDDVGLFDEDYFMYYEDMDLAWRARRRGWKVLYVPGAVVRHVHAASSVEWSPFFLYHVELNRLLMLAKNAPLSLALGEHLRYALAASVGVGRWARSITLRSPDRPGVSRRARTQMRVLAALAARLPRTAAGRWALRRRELVPTSELMGWRVSA